jgi:K+-sensing histidine kinase KdpD
LDTDSTFPDAGAPPASKEGPRLGQWVTWLAMLVLVTVALVALRSHIGAAHVVLVYVLVVLGGSARGGRALGLVLAVATFLSFNFFFLEPYNTFHVGRSLDWLALVTYLITAVAVAQLLHRAEREAAGRLRLAAAAEHARALGEAARLKDSLIAAISHDLRTPITTIRALAHDIASEGDDRALAVAEEADRLGRLVSDLLDLSHLRAGALPVRVEVNAVEDVVGAAIQQTTGVLGGRELRAAVDPGAPVLGRFDFVHTLRVLVNLIENAVKYAPGAEPIDLEAHRRGGDVVFTVADRGPGLPEGERDRVFQPYYRAGNAPPDAGGAGLGLAIASGLAEAQGGTLRHEPRPGGGSIFALTLPGAELPRIEEAGS